MTKMFLIFNCFSFFNFNLKFVDVKTPDKAYGSAANLQITHQAVKWLVLYFYAVGVATLPRRLIIIFGTQKATK